MAGAVPVRGRYPEPMSEQPASVSADDLHALQAATQQAARWEDAVRRAERGEIIAVVAHGEHVADVVPSGELDRLRETIEVLSDAEAMRDLADNEPVVHGIGPSVPWSPNALPVRLGDRPGTDQEPQAASASRTLHYASAMSHVPRQPRTIQVAP